MISIHKTMWLLAGAFCLGACSLDATPSSSPEQTTPRSDEANSFIDPGNTWADPRHIPVCFLDVSAPRRAFIQAAVEREYSGRVGFGYTGWGDCDSLGARATAIRIDCNRDPRYQAEGHSLVGPGRVRRAGDSTMVFRCEHFDKNSKFARHLVVHEFGHAMSLWHEHERDDSRCNQGERERADRDHVKVGPFDPASVMSYCSDNDTLTGGDIEGLLQLYPSLRGSPAPNPAPFPTVAPTVAPTAAPTAPPAPAPGSAAPEGCQGSRSSCWNEAETREMAAWKACEPQLSAGAEPACLAPLRRLTGPLAHTRAMYQHACDEGQQLVCSYLRTLDHPGESPRLLAACNAGQTPNLDPACKRLLYAPWLLAGSGAGAGQGGGQVGVSIGGRRWTARW